MNVGAGVAARTGDRVESAKARSAGGAVTG
jgi:hypothetical protein